MGDDRSGVLCNGILASWCLWFSSFFFADLPRRHCRAHQCIAPIDAIGTVHVTPRARGVPGDFDNTVWSNDLLCLFHESKHRNVSTSIATLNRWRVRRSSHRGPPPPCVTEGSGYLGSRLVPWCLWFFSSLYWPCQTTLAGRRLGARPGRPTGRTGCRRLSRERQAGCVQTRSPIGRVRP